MERNIYQMLHGAGVFTYMTGQFSGGKYGSTMEHLGLRSSPRCTRISTEAESSRSLKDLVANNTSNGHDLRYILCEIGENHKD